MGIWKKKAPIIDDQLPVDDILRYLRAGSVIRYESGLDAIQTQLTNLTERLSHASSDPN